MASAGLLKILSSGLQDERLVSKGQPSTEFFQTVFIRAGRFTTEWHRIDFDNKPTFGNTANASIPRRGHLITRVYLVTQLPDIITAQTTAKAVATAAGKTFAGPTIGWTNSIGHALVEEAQITIGGSPIDTLDGRLLEMLDEFHTPLEKTTIVNRLLGRSDNGFSPSSNQGQPVTGQTVVTPLPFWFARGDPAAALPIDAITVDAVQMSVTFAPLANLTVSSKQITNADGLRTYASPLSAPFSYTDGTQIPGVTMPASLQLQDASLLLEYVYLDKPEANRIRLGDLTYPIVQHYAIEPVQTRKQSAARVLMRIPNPIRDLYFMVHPTDADLLNAPFLATRDLCKLPTDTVPWWPNATGLNTTEWLPLTPAFSDIESEPLQSFSLLYEGSLVRYATDCPALFRTAIQSFEQTKTPWHNKYYYHLPFGTQHEMTGVTRPMGHGNLDKIHNIELSLQFTPGRGEVRGGNSPAYTIYVWAETYTMFRVYGGRGGLLFGY